MNINSTSVIVTLALFATACGGNSNSTDTKSDSAAQESTQNEEPQVASTPIILDPQNPILTSLEVTEYCHFYLLKNGDVGYQYPESDTFSESGKYIFDNGAYIVVWGMGDFLDSIDLIYGDTRYTIASLMDPGMEEIQLKFAGEMYTKGAECIQEVMSFDPETKSLKIKKGDEWQSIALSTIPAEDQVKITLD